MDTTHWIVVGVVLVDEAIDAARFLALRELRDWLERNRAAGSASKLS